MNERRFLARGYLSGPLLRLPGEPCRPSGEFLRGSGPGFVVKTLSSVSRFGCGSVGALAYHSWHLHLVTEIPLLALVAWHWMMSPSVSRAIVPPCVPSSSPQPSTYLLLSMA